MYFSIVQPGQSGHFQAMIRKQQSEFTSQTAGVIILGPLEIPREINMLFNGEFLERLPCDLIFLRMIKKEEAQMEHPSFEWPMRMQFIAESLILHGWQLSRGGYELEHVDLGLPDLVKEWMRDLRGAHFAFALFQQLRELGFSAHAEHANVEQAVCV